MRDAPELPESLAYLWGIFVQLANHCEVMDFVQIKAWSELMRTALLPEEVEVLLALDLEQQKVRADGHGKPKNNGR